MMILMSLIRHMQHRMSAQSNLRDCIITEALSNY
jgi:hypothetical protein